MDVIDIVLKRPGFLISAVIFLTGLILIFWLVEKLKDLSPVEKKSKDTINPEPTENIIDILDARIKQITADVSDLRDKVKQLSEISGNQQKPDNRIQELEQKIDALNKRVDAIYKILSEEADEKI